MSDSARRPVRIQPLLLAGKRFGLVLLLGGLAALSCIGLLASTPETQDGWVHHVGVMRAIFWPCVFAGLVITIVFGILLWGRNPRQYLTRGWFRLKGLLLLTVVPGLHFWARGRVQDFYELIDAESPTEAIATAWAGVWQAFFVTFLIVLALACLAMIKPRFGRPSG